MSSNMYRKMRKADLEALNGSIKALSDKYGRESVVDSLKSFKGNHVLIAEDDDGSIVGWKIVDDDGNTVSEIPPASSADIMHDDTDEEDDFWSDDYTDEYDDSYDDSSAYNGAPDAHASRSDSLNQNSATADDKDDIRFLDDDFEETKQYGGYVRYRESSAYDHIGDTAPLHVEDYSDDYDDDNWQDDEESHQARHRKQDGYNKRGTKDSYSNLDDVKRAKKSNRKADKQKHRKAPIIILMIVITVCCALAAVVISSASAGNVSDGITVLLTDARRAITGVDNNANGNGDIDYDSYQQADEHAIAHINVQDGDLPTDIRGELLSAGMVFAAKDFMSAVSDAGAESSIKSGDYIVTGDETADEIVSRMMSGDRIPDGVIGVNSGDDIRTIESSISNAGDTGSITVESFDASVRDIEKWRKSYAMLSTVPDNLPSVEGYIAGGEYNLRAYGTADDLVDAMLSQTESRYEDSGMNATSWFETLTKASMIEKEALFDEDRPLIASVIDNRLARGMKLQIDATVKYANGSDNQRVLNSDLDVDSPYNTYKVNGLPIGPICSAIPDKDIAAVTSHEQTDYLYYVLKDKDGHHEFCTTQEQFEQARQKYMELFGYTD